MLLEIDPNTQQQIEAEISKTHYEVQRYKLNATFALLYFEGDLTKQQIQNGIRESDTVLVLNTNYIFITFHFTDESDAIKAGENLLLSIDKILHNTSSYIAIDRIDSIESPKSTLNRLYQIIQEARKHSNNRVEDENILNDVY